MFKIKDKAKNLGLTMMGLAILCGLALISAGMFWGMASLSKFLYPIFSILAAIFVLIFLLIILPLSFFHRFRPFLATTSIIMSMVCGASVWMYSFLIIIGYLGWVAIFLVFLFNFVTPIAIIGLFFKQQWAAGFSIMIGLFFAYGMRFYGLWLADLYDRKDKYFTRLEYEREAIKTFRKLCIINLVLYLLVFAGAVIVSIYFPTLYQKIVNFRLFTNLFLALLIILWLILLAYLYLTSKILKLSGDLNVRPSLVLIFTIVSAYTFYILSLIAIIIVWIKASVHLKYAEQKINNIKEAEIV